MCVFYYSNSQIKSCHYTLLYRNYGSIRFYMCSTVQSPQAVLNGVINLLSIKDSRDILISVNYTINLHIFVTDLVDNHIIFPYRIFIICPKADPFGGRVDTPITWCAPHRSGRAAFPHPALYGTNYSTAIHICSRIFSVSLGDMHL